MCVCRWGERTARIACSWALTWPSPAPPSSLQDHRRCHLPALTALRRPTTFARGHACFRRRGPRPSSLARRPRQYYPAPRSPQYFHNHLHFLYFVRALDIVRLGRPRVRHSRLVKQLTLQGFLRQFHSATHLSTQRKSISSSFLFLSVLEKCLNQA